MLASTSSFTVALIDGAARQEKQHGRQRKTGRGSGSAKSAGRARCSCWGLLALAASSVMAGDALNGRSTSPWRRLPVLESTSAPIHALNRRAHVSRDSSTATPALVTATLTVTANATSSGPLALASSQAGTPTATRTSDPMSSTASASGSASTVVPSGYIVPQPFDSTLGVDFASTACPSFFQTFLADPTFISCVPFSLLLTTSSGFFDAQKSPKAELPFVLDASCSADFDKCSALMSELAQKIQQPNTCGPDLTSQKATVVEALQGFQNYAMQQKVGCQKDETTKEYCYAKAAAQVPANDIYFYLLPSGTSLPSGTTSSCSGCVQSQMLT